MEKSSGSQWKSKCGDTEYRTTPGNSQTLGILSAHSLFLLTNFKNHIYTYTNMCVCLYVYIFIYTHRYIYVFITLSVQHISPGLTRAFSHVLFPVWKRLQIEQKTRLTSNDFSGRNLVTAREGHRVNQFFQMVCRKAIYEEEKGKNKVVEKRGERGKNKQISPFWHQAAAEKWWQGRGKQQTEKSRMSLVQLKAFRTWKDNNQNPDKCSGVQLW